MLLFPSWENFLGCIVTLISCWLYFENVFKISIIREHPIGFIATLQIFLFMYLPLPVTLLDGNEMSHDMFIPSKTYLLQLIYFCIAILAFHFAGMKNRQNKVYCWLKKIGYFYRPSNSQLWILGIIGLIFRLFMMSKQGSEDSLVGAGTLNMFSGFIYCPILILFNSLLGKNRCSKKSEYVVYAYIIFLFILLIATNSRSMMLSPLVVFVFCYIIKQIYTYRNTLWLSYRKIIFIIFALLIISGPAADMAIAMVMVRGDRSSMSFSELFDKSIEAYKDKEGLNAYRKMMDKNQPAIGADWQEYYVSSPFLDRLCNYRVADATIYHAQRIGFLNKEMLDYFGNLIITMFPGPIVKALFPDVDKSYYNFSPMDKLYHYCPRKSFNNYSNRL